MKIIAYVSGKIENEKRDCFVGEQKVACPPEKNSTLQTGEKLDLLPQISSWETRNDLLFSAVVLLVIFILAVLTVLRVKIFGKTLIEYVKPIWYLILICLAVVLWQYLFGLQIDDNLIYLRISQWIWEACIAISAYKLIKTANFGYGNLFFLAIIYSLIIHGLKVSIRYFFYAKNLLYIADRFLYGSMLVMAIAFLLGSILLFFRRREILKF